jgi:hypothetical protein
MPSMPSIAEQAAVMAREQPQARVVSVVALEEAVRQATSWADLLRRLAELGVNVG